jgi:hypothetical protein
MRTLAAFHSRTKPIPTLPLTNRRGGVALRHHDEVELIALCRRLEWNMDDAEREREKRPGQTAPSDLYASHGHLRRCMRPQMLEENARWEPRVP